MNETDQQPRMTKRVLVVDDEQSIQELLQHLLEEEGYEVETAGDGREALARLARSPFDLVLCDMMMPFMNGLQFCRAVQQSEAAFRHVPLVLMSAAGPPGPETGCHYTAFISKPFNLNRLFDVRARLIPESH